MSVFVAIETSTAVGSVAIGRGADVIGEVTIGVHTRHARAVLPALDFLLRTTETSRRDIAGIVVGAGPGSFTGVRIAAAAARGLVQGFGVPLYAYSSLAALAVDATSAGPVCTLFDARRGEVYAACYESAGRVDTLTTLLEPTTMRAAEVCAALANVTDAPVTFIGDGARRYADELGLRGAVHAPYPRAGALLRLRAADPGPGRIDQASGWEPSYLRASGAERMGGGAG